MRNQIGFKLLELGLKCMDSEMASMVRLSLKIGEQWMLANRAETIALLDGRACLAPTRGALACQHEIEHTPIGFGARH